MVIDISTPVAFKTFFLSSINFALHLRIDCLLRVTVNPNLSARDSGHTHCATQETRKERMDRLLINPVIHWDQDRVDPLDILELDECALFTLVSFLAAVAYLIYFSSSSCSTVTVAHRRF